MTTVLKRLEQIVDELPNYEEAVGPPAPLKEALMYVVEYIRFMEGDIMAQPQNLINAEALLALKLQEGMIFAASFGGAFEG